MGLSQEIHDKGKLAVSQRSFQLFEAFNRLELQEQYTFAARHTERSQYLLRRILIDKLEALEGNGVAGFYIHGRDAFLHSTAVLCKWVTDDPGSQATFSRMQCDPVLQPIKETLKGEEQLFNDLIVDDRGYILLTNDQAAPSITAFRGHISSLLKNRNITLHFQNWQHMVLARITRYQQERTGELLDAICELRQYVNTSPFIMNVHEIWSGCVADLLL